MTTTYKKKLIEVAIPLEAINAASAREKSIRHGHPSTLHLWWARRPLAACRAVLFAQLVDDPSSLPDQFPTAELQDTERKRLFAILEDLVKWENSTNEEVLERARAEIRRSCGGVLPPVYDPFSGGGSIPLEAQRLGLPAYGSDLNPVAVMIGKAMIEIPSKFKDRKPVHPGANDRNHYRNAEGLAEDVKYYGQWMREQAWERIGHLYPQVDLTKEYGGGKGTAVAWLWARTVKCMNPGCRCEMPLLTSFELASKAGSESYIVPRIENGNLSFEISSKFDSVRLDPKKGYKRGMSGIFECAFCMTVTTRDYVADEGMAGRIGSMLTAIVVEGPKGRIFLPASATQIPTVFPEQDNSHLQSAFQPNPRDLWCRNFGLLKPQDLFSPRQLTALNVFSDLVGEVRTKIANDCGRTSDEDDIALRDNGLGALAYAEAVSLYLAFAVDRVADSCSMIATWATGGFIRSTFGRQAIPMTWDFAECNVFSDSTGNFLGAIDWIYRAVSEFRPSSIGIELQCDAQSVALPEGAVISTDPPYYDNIGYADLSDFFYAWLKKTMKPVFPDLTSTIAVPKTQELVAITYRHKAKADAETFFLEGMTEVISGLARQTSSEFPATIYYAFKQSEIEKEGLSSTGWSTFLQAIISAGYTIAGTWPVRTERAARTIAKGTNALANSVVLVCRKKESSAETVTRAEFIRALKRELPSAIKELQAANIAPADMPQSAIGPGMGVFSRFKAVLESDDCPMSVKSALQLINRELDEYLGGIQGEFDAETRFAITWFEQNGLKAGDYGTANNIATARGISVESVKHAGVVESAAGKVRILSRNEMDPDWEPGADSHLTIWECLQHLVRVHETDGLADTAAEMLKQIGSNAEAVKDLAYCLYDICANKRKDAKEATSYNALIADWTELTRLAASASNTRRGAQMRMDV